MNEWLDVVDAFDRPVRRERRDIVHEDALRHRAVSVWICDPRGNLWIQQRSEHKDQEPGLYSPTASGHVDAGEGYRAAAQRELFEEAGLTATLCHLTTLPATKATGLEFTAIFVGVTPEQPNPCPIEVRRMRNVRHAELAEWLRRQPGLFSSSFVATYHWLHASNQLPGRNTCS